MFISLALLIGLASVNTGANLLYLVLSMMLSMLIISGIVARANLGRLSARRLYPLEFHAGRAVQGRIELLNDKRVLTSYALGIRDVIEGPLGGGKAGETHLVKAFVLMVPPHQRASCQIKLNLSARGLYMMRQVRILSRFPFGFFEKMRVQEEIGKILVYPRLLPAVAVLTQCPRLAGELEADRKGFGSGIFSVRDYEPGDPARFIHWKLSAKGHGLKVKEMEQEESRCYRLMLDLRCPEAPSPALRERFEKAVSVAATLARILLRQGATVALWTSEGNVPLSEGTRHLQRIMRALAEIQPLAPDAPVIPAPADEHEVSPIWIEYRAEEERPSELAGGTGRGAGRRHEIDVRRIVVPEPSEDDPLESLPERMD